MRSPAVPLLLAALAAFAPCGAAAEERAAAALPEWTRWSLSGDVRAVGGHRDNVLLSPVVPSSSNFARVEADLFAWRMPVATTDFLLFLSGSETHYFDLPSDAQAERMWLARAEYRYDLGEYFRATLTGDVLYQEQVFDLSESLADTFRARLKLSSFSLGPTLHWEIRRPWWFDVKASGQRADFRGAAEDSHDLTGTVRIGRHLGARHNLSLAWTGRWKNYDTRNAYTIGGRAIAGTDLAVTRQEGELRLESTWGAAAAWKTKLSGGAVANRDSASGYFDFNRWQAAAQLEYRRGPWSGSARVRGKDSRYLVQVVGEGFEPEARRMRDFDGEVKFARKLGKDLEVSAEFSRERSRTNAELASYTINTWLVGVEAGW